MKSQTALHGCIPPDQTLTRRAGIFVLRCVIDKVVLAEPTIGSGSRGDRLWHEHCNACLMTREDFFALEVPSISDDGEIINAHFRACEARHRREFVPVEIGRA